MEASSEGRHCLVSRHRIGHECQGRSRAIDVILHRRRPAHPDRPDKFSIDFDRKTSPVRRHTRQCGDAGQERRVALDEVEEVLRRHAEQSRVRLILRNLDAQNRRPVHAAKGLEIAAVIEHGDVLGDPNRSCLRNGFIHHPLCQLRRNTVFLDEVSHWTFSLVYCALIRAACGPTSTHPSGVCYSGNRSPNIGRPLLDSACDASSSTTSQCSTSIPSTTRTKSATIQFFACPKPEKRLCTITNSPSATICSWSCLKVGGMLLIRLKRPSRPGSMWALCWM